MGTAIDFNFLFNFNLDFSDFIEILSIGVNAILGFWIVRTIQNKLTNQRVLKDHFISEIKDLRAEYNEFVKRMYNGLIEPQETLRWFKIASIKKNHLLSDIRDIYTTSDDKLDEFHNKLHDIVINSNEFIMNYRTNSPIRSSPITQRKLDNLQTAYNGIFNKLIIIVNNFRQ